jgi:hypothetical protein
MNDSIFEEIGEKVLRVRSRDGSPWGVLKHPSAFSVLSQRLE